MIEKLWNIKNLLKNCFINDKILKLKMKTIELKLLLN